jgi:predicted AlkP superfamily pyrophosphatase or phosphodiesterase
MLSASKSARFSLADVLTSCLAAIGAQGNALSLPGVDKAVVLLVDGLGATSLKASAAHARTLAPLLNATTTATALASLATGKPAGEHGLVGYEVLDVAHDRVVNQLTGWDDRLDPSSWQRSRTVFELAADASVPAFAVGVERYRSTGFTQAVLRGAEYRAGVSIEDRLAVVRGILDSHQRALVYVYVPELDQTAHKFGWESSRWTDRLEELDAAVRGFSTGLGKREGLILTADHGIVDVADHNHILFDADPRMLDGIRHIAGEPRCLQLHFEADASDSLRERVTTLWRQSEESRAWVATREEAIADGWFGASVHPEVAPRIGDLLVAARKAIAYYDGRDEQRAGRTMVGQHGSLSREELLVPVLRFGAFA